MKKLRNVAFLLLMVVILVFGAPSRAMALPCWSGCNCDYDWWHIYGDWHLMWVMNCLNACELITEPGCEADIGELCWVYFEDAGAGACYPGACIAVCDLGIVE